MKTDPAYIVIDTNVLISAGLLPQSKTAQVLALAVEHFVIAQNQLTWQENWGQIRKLEKLGSKNWGQIPIFFCHCERSAAIHGSLRASR
jgi:predicted nucleic acid-binding protein